MRFRFSKNRGFYVPESLVVVVVKGVVFATTVVAFSTTNVLVFIYLDGTYLSYILDSHSTS